MTVNHELLDDTLFYIKMHPDEWHQGYWATRNDCGTAYCFAGTACMLNSYEAYFAYGYEQSTDYVSKKGRVYKVNRRIGSLGRELLGLDEHTANRLFDATNTLPELEKMVALIHEKEELTYPDVCDIRDECSDD